MLYIDDNYKTIAFFQSRALLYTIVIERADVKGVQTRNYLPEDIHHHQHSCYYTPGFILKASDTMPL